MTRVMTVGDLRMSFRTRHATQSLGDVCKRRGEKLKKKLRMELFPRNDARGNRHPQKTAMDKRTAISQRAEAGMCRFIWSLPSNANPRRGRVNRRPRLSETHRRSG